MAPEYIAKGLFSVKSDVFSFGILVLEIIYGKKSGWFYDSCQNHNLLGHVSMGDFGRYIFNLCQTSFVICNLCVFRHGLYGRKEGL